MGRWGDWEMGRGREEKRMRKGEERGFFAGIK